LLKRDDVVGRRYLLQRGKGVKDPSDESGKLARDEQDHREKKGKLYGRGERLVRERSTRSTNVFQVYLF